MAPAGLAFAVLLTRKVFPGAQGSGIPQTIAALHMHDPADMDGAVAAHGHRQDHADAGGPASGASIGREGPTVQVGAAMMHALGGCCDCRGWICSAAWCWRAGRPACPPRSTRRWPAWCLPSRNWRIPSRAHLGHGDRRGDPGGHHHPRAGRQLLVFRRHIGGSGFRRGLDGGGGVRDRGRACGGRVLAVLITAARGIPGAAGRLLIRHPCCSRLVAAWRWPSSARCPAMRPMAPAMRKRAACCARIRICRRCIRC